MTIQNRRPRSIVSYSAVAAICATLLLAPPASALGGDGAAGVPVEWVLSSSDTFESAVERASDTQGTDAVATALAEFAQRAAGGESIDFPGFESVAPEDAATLLSSVASALGQGAELPEAAAQLELSPADAPEAAPFGEVINDRRSFVEWNWIERGVTTGGGGVKWTDRVELRWTTNPGAVESVINYYTTKPLDSGFFDNIRIRTRAYQGDNAMADTLWRPSNVGSVDRIIRNDRPYNGKTIWHRTELAATSLTTGQHWVDNRTTIYALCKPDSNVCLY